MVCCARCLIVAPDIRASPTAQFNPVNALGGIMRTARAAGVPVVFALSRRGIGQVCTGRIALAVGVPVVLARTYARACMCE